MSTTSLHPSVLPDHGLRILRLDADANGMSMSAEEFDAVEDYDSHFHYELIRGVVVVVPVPDEAHERPIDFLAYLLQKYKFEHVLGSTLDETLPGRFVRTNAGNRRRADRVVWAGLGRRPDATLDVPAIVIEIVSRSRRDRQRDYVEKRQEYREAGVTEYWIIDRFRRRMTVAFADGSERIVSEQEAYPTPILPGFELPLESLLARADQ